MGIEGIYNPCIHWNKKGSQFDLKSWVTGGTKIRPGISSNWRTVDVNWLDIECQFKLTFNIESISFKYSPITRIPGRILVPPVTQLFMSKWLPFFFQWSFLQFLSGSLLAIYLRNLSPGYLPICRAWSGGILLRGIAAISPPSPRNKSAIEGGKGKLGPNRKLLPLRASS